MEYTVEELSPVKKKVTVSLEAKEVDASIVTTVALYRSSVKLDGFRPGKVPASVVESRFRQKIYEEAKQDIVNANTNEVIEKMGVTPVSGFDFDGGDLQRGTPYSYTISFEVLPSFDMPAYEGMEVEQEKAVVKPEEVDEVINKILKDRAELVPASGNGPAVDGQAVEVDFSASEDGKPLAGINAKNFQLALGEKQALEDFETLVKTVPLGEEKEGQVTFPADFVAPDLAGKTVTMTVKVNVIKDRKLPEMTDELAKTMGQDNVEALRSAIEDSYAQNRNNLYKGTAQKTLLDKLLKMVDFPLPEAMVNMHVRSILTDRRLRLERQGKSLASFGKSQEDLEKEVRPEAESIARAQAFLMCAAQKEKIEVTDQEVDFAIFQMAQRSGEDFKKLKDTYVRSGAVYTLRDRILADKAMEAIYGKAKIVEHAPRENDAANA